MSKTDWHEALESRWTPYYSTSDNRIGNIMKIGRKIYVKVGRASSETLLSCGPVYGKGRKFNFVRVGEFFGRFPELLM